jgi:hypothetical protein
MSSTVEMVLTGKPRSKIMYKVSFNKTTNQWQVINLMFGVVASFNSRKEAMQHRKQLDGDSMKDLMDAFK